MTGRPLFFLRGSQGVPKPLPFMAKIGAAHHALIPGSKLALLKQCGHLPQVEKPEEYLRVISDFIAEVHAR